MTGGGPLLIFDCDGVLVDSELIASATLEELLTSLGHAMTTQYVLERFVGRSLKDVLLRAERLLGRPIPADLGARFGADLLVRFREELKPVDGIRQAIAALPHRRCVASSSWRSHSCRCRSARSRSACTWRMNGTRLVSRKMSP